MAISWIEIVNIVVLFLSAALLVWLWKKRGTLIRAFIGEVIVELKKCTWPWDPKEKGIRKYKELIDSTLAVSIYSIILAAIVTSADFILVRVVHFIITLHF
ncbi:preprotein translocase subunit SecE [Candidatus Methylacidiphilum fumarolicum]|uniref:Preprotein translocase subunit SecE n=2 Tax=Candidatus Methylacidiphilum fumarolicum TaxID=591154 RepID=I0JX28_METFB|nr:preprotein translocase subunit SecE [Candidatus Methylacidiphilum fumarolicum]TFE69485.1 preprotein translocase subunit SecE [Candidatus Methylacidiphilum fumarolicum]TFE77119.1 preprotein translocase subunit SecE [Candidatus Methylacidiphilum fumarolicum]CAI9085396.1 Preprotein translocase subunit SecE [Candidatus Methylacidiphilum fumarolicum]CCG91797.1 Preprotein translocase subunit SecE [Methylacidiphilum fumariolicum SolV]